MEKPDPEMVARRLLQEAAEDRLERLEAMRVSIQKPSRLPNGQPASTPEGPQIAPMVTSNVNLLPGSRAPQNDDTHSVQSGNLCESPEDRPAKISRSMIDVALRNER